MRHDLELYSVPPHVAVGLRASVATGDRSVVFETECGLFEIDRPLDARDVGELLLVLGRDGVPLAEIARRVRLPRPRIEGLLSDLVGLGVVVRVTAPEFVARGALSFVALPPGAQQRLEGGSAVVLRGDRRLTRAIAAQLRALGVPLRPSAGAGILLSALVRPSLAARRRTLRAHRQAQARGARTLTVELDGGMLYVGPVVAAAGPCYRCLCLRRGVEREALALLPPGEPVFPDALVETIALRVAFELLHLQLVGAPSPDLAGGVASATLETLPVLQPRSLLPHPSCERCGRRESRPEDIAVEARRAGRRLRTRLLGPGQAVDARRVIADVRKIVDPLVGVLLSFDLRDAAGEAQVSNADINLPHMDMQARGFGKTKTQRQLTCAAEAAERYATFLAQPDIAGATLAELAPWAVPPPALGLYTSAQYDDPTLPAARFSARRRYDWCWALDLVRGQPRLLPLDVLAARSPATRPLVLDFGSGAAAHTSYPAAVANALREVLERDAVMVCWLCRLAAPRIEERTLPAALRREVQRLQATFDVDVALLDLALISEVPVLLALASQRREHAGVRPGARWISAAASLSPAIAAAHALHELGAACAAIHGGLASMVTAPSYPENPVQTLFYFLEPAHARSMDFLWSGPTEPWTTLRRRHGATRPADAREETQLIISRLAARGYDVFCADITTDDLRATTPLRVVKVVVPQLQPLTFGAPRLGCVRARRALSDHGLATRLLDLDELNPDPHPFA